MSATNVVQLHSGHGRDGVLCRFKRAWLEVAGRDAELLATYEQLVEETAKLEAIDEYAELDSDWMRIARRLGRMQPTTLAGYRAKTHALRTAMEWAPDAIAWLDPEDEPDATSAFLEWRL
jgi:hypothetical protein